MSGSKVNVLLVGSGGREHALAWKMLQSPRLEKLYVAPGNGGTAGHNVAIKSTDVDSLAAFAKENDCFTVVGPEAPLELGLVDKLTELDLESFGPTRAAARLETSKAYAKEFMLANGIPTARFRIFSKFDEALAYAGRYGGDVVVKADGLAGGKGVFLCSNMSEAEAALRSILTERTLGRAGDNVIIEERLRGYEVSLMALCDGRDAVAFGTAMDHKRLLDGDRGPNTGGMGAFSPALNFNESQRGEVMERIVRPVVRRTGFKGFLYTGLMVTEDGPMVLEFNARLGDPETQSILPRLESDLLGSLLEIESSGALPEPVWGNSYCCSVVMCSRGYPGSVEIGFPIFGLASAEELKNVLIFHAGTKQDPAGELRTAGGRVICACGLGPDLARASEAAYSAVELISWEGEHHRNDVGRRGFRSG